MTAAICIENICSGLATAAFAAFMMNLCDKRFTATQYALLTSFMAITRILVQTPSGFIAKSLGWEMYFIVSILISIELNLFKDKNLFKCLKSVSNIYALNLVI